MELSWMKKHRSLIGKMIRFANTYATMYTKVTDLGAELRLSAAQIQTLEYVLENEDCNMSELAQKLGVPRATFSKTTVCADSSAMESSVYCQSSKIEHALRQAVPSRFVYCSMLNHKSSV